MRGLGWVGLAATLVVLAGASAAWRYGPGLMASRAASEAIRLGRGAYGRGDWREAEFQARRVAQAKGGRETDPDALRLLARSLARQGRDDSARRVYRRLGPEAMKAEDNLAVALMLVRDGRRDDARQALRFALQDEPSHPEARLVLAGLELDASRPAEAAELAEPLLGDGEDRAAAGVLVGRARDLLGQPSEAAAALSAALGADPALKGASLSAAEARKLLARDLLKLGRPAEARAQAEAVLEGGVDAEASWILARALLKVGDADRARSALADAGPYSEGHPERFEPAAFVGAARCGECHGAIHEAQQGSRHARTLHRAEEFPDLPLPSGPVNDPSAPGVVHEIRREGGRVDVSTRSGGEHYRALVEYVLGSGGRGATLVGRDEGGRVRELRLSYFGKTGGWDVTTGHPPVPARSADALGLDQSADALHACLGCHSTSPRAVLDRSGPTQHDRAIGCERCHGPGGDHEAALSADLPDPMIGRPRLASAEGITTLCGSCHGVGDRPIPKDDPSLLIRFQATTLPMSECYTKSGGALSCVTCHDPHRDAETSASYYEGKCLSCHDAEASRASLPEPARRVACPVDPKRGCVGCHMPTGEGQMRHSSFTDHAIRVHPAPRP